MRSASLPAGLYVTVWLWCSPVLADSPRTDVEATGRADPRLVPFGRLMREFLREHELPGAALAVAHKGKLVYARGFGYSDRDAGELVGPRALFRIASISKPLTALAVLQLVERG